MTMFVKLDENSEIQRRQIPYYTSNRSHGQKLRNFVTVRNLLVPVPSLD